MISSESIPEGKVISSINGGPNSLDRLIDKLKKYEFTGYIMTTLRHVDAMCQGFLIIKNGNLTAAIYGRLADGRFAPNKMGEEGLKLVWGDSYDKDCTLEVHGRLDIDAMLRHFPAAGLGKLPEKKVLKRRTRFSLEWKDDEPEPTESEDIDLPPELKAMLEEWVKADYIVKSLLEDVKKDPKNAELAFERFGNNVGKVEFLKREIEAMDHAKYGEDIGRIKALLRNPAKITNIEASVQGLRLKIGQETPRPEVKAPADRLTPEPADEPEPRLGGQGDIFPPEKAPSDACTICGADLHGRAECPTCGSEGGFSDGEGRPTDASGLISTFTFESFIVGKCNSFSHAAAVAASKPGSSYNNPVIICSPSGLGKTHLLNAVGNYVVANLPDMKVLCVTAERWASEYLDSVKAKSLAQFRKKYQNLDFLLVDDINRFSAKPDAVQEEFLRIADALNGKKKQLIFTCERPSNQVSEFEERLTARFPANLVTAMEPPELNTRHDILKKKAEGRKLVVADAVLEYIARRYRRNVRVLENALNKLVSYSKLMSVPMTLETVKEALKDDPVEPSDEPEAEAASGMTSLDTKIDTLKMSHSYLIEEERPVKCFEYFVDNLNIGMKGLALTRINPKRVREQYDIGDSSVLWLTDREGDAENHIPPVLERIIYKIEDFLNTPGKSILLIDGLDYLVSNNNFDSVLRFLRRLIDEVSESDAIFITSITPETMSEQGLKILEREMEIISFLDRDNI